MIYYKPSQEISTGGSIDDCPNSLVQGTKLFEITNSLADVLICVPSFTAGKDKGLDLRDVIFGLCRLLASFRGGDPAVVSLLAEKLVTSGVMLLDPRQAIAPIDESGDDDQDYHADRLL